VSSWLEGLPIGWLIVVVFAATFAVTAALYLGVERAAEGQRAAAFKAVSPGMLPPMGLVFGLIVGFLVAGLWNDLSDARDAVNREASSLRSAELVVDGSFPGVASRRIDALIGQHIETAATREWPAMANQKATLTVVPVSLARALQLTLTLKPVGAGQVTAQRELVSLFENALDARRQRIIVSRSSVNWVKWTAVIALAILTLLLVALVHSDNRLTAALAMGTFGAAVAVTLVLIAAQARPFSGQFGVRPDVLLQVQPPA
jgi:hypothetical protein